MCRIQAVTQHTDWLTDKAVCQTTQNLLVINSYHGMIKVLNIILEEM